MYKSNQTFLVNGLKLFEISNNANCNQEDVEKKFWQIVKHSTTMVADMKLSRTINGCKDHLIHVIELSFSRSFKLV